MLASLKIRGRDDTGLDCIEVPEDEFTGPDHVLQLDHPTRNDVDELRATHCIEVGAEMDVSRRRSSVTPCGSTIASG